MVTTSATNQPRSGQGRSRLRRVLPRSAARHPALDLVQDQLRGKVGRAVLLWLVASTGLEMGLGAYALYLLLSARERSTKPVNPPSAPLASLPVASLPAAVRGRTLELLNELS